MGSIGRAALALALVCAFPLLAVAYLVVIGPAARQDACDTSTPGVVARARDLTPAQRAHAATIIDVGRQLRVPDQGIVVALAVASQESGFRVYANDGNGGDLAVDQAGIDASLALPHEAVGTDHGSLGLFQQQWPWWGTMRQLMDPATSARLFYQRLSQTPGWESLTVTDAAQAVQRSAAPGAYADDEPLARRLLATAAPTTTTVGAAAHQAPQSADAGHVADTRCDAVLAAAATVPLGDKVFPLPRGAAYVDQHNFGHTGSNWSSFHTGTDLSTACGTPVLAATDGTVIIDPTQLWAGPMLVEITTGPGRLTTWYAHMQAVDVRQGERVHAGQIIGAVGDLGNATGCHLHFEVHPSGGTIYEDPIDPSAWLVRDRQG